MGKFGTFQPDDRGWALPRHVRCPLCRSTVDTSDCADDGQVACEACDLSFNVLDTVQRQRQLEAARAAAANPTDPAPADPLQKWLAGSPLEPLKRTIFQEALIWAGRHRWLVGSTVACVLVLAATAVCLSLACRNLADAGRQAIRERDDMYGRCAQLEEDAEQAARSLEQTVNNAFQRRQRELRIDIAGEIADDAKAVAAQSPEQSLALAVLAMRMARREGVSPDRSALQLIYQLTTRSDDSASKLLGRVDVLAASPDGRWLAGGCPDGNVRLLDLSSPSSELPVIELTSALNHVAAFVFTSDGRWLLARGVDSTISAWRLDRPDIARQERVVLRVPENRIVDLTIGGDNRWAIACCNGFRPCETTIRLWDLTAADPSEAYVDFSGNQGRVQSVTMSKNGKWVAVGNVGGTIALWNSESQQPHSVASVLRSGNSFVHSLNFSPDSRRLIAATGSSGRGHAIHIWDLTAADPEADPIVLRGHSGAVQKIALTADGRWLASAGENDRVRLWDLTAEHVDHCVAKFDGLTGQAAALEFNADGRLLVGANIDGNACLWSTAYTSSDQPLMRFPIAESPLTSLVFARDGRWLATSSADQTVRLWTISADDAFRHAANVDGRTLPIVLTHLFRKPAGVPTFDVAGKPQTTEQCPVAKRGAPSGPTSFGKPAPAAKTAPAAETAGKSESNPLR